MMRKHLIFIVLIPIIVFAYSQVVAQGGEGLPDAAGEAKEKAASVPNNNSKDSTAAKTPEGMVRIPGGWFKMGCSPGDSNCAYDEKLPKRVFIDTFYMDARETTQKEYEKVMGSNPSDFEDCPDCPVQAVSWYDAGYYCKKVGKRLPTEAEWEYAARGKTKGIRYGDLESIAWYADNSDDKPHPVGKKKPNAFGLYDMLGNVYEWCEDRYDKDWYGRMPERNPVNHFKGRARVIRGGSWLLNFESFRSSNRCELEPSLKSLNVGFRCARDR